MVPVVDTFLSDPKAECLTSSNSSTTSAALLELYFTVHAVLLNTSSTSQKKPTGTEYFVISEWFQHFLNNQVLLVGTQCILCGD